MIVSDFGEFIAERMRVEHRRLAIRWLARLVDLLPVEAREIFPTDSLLDHIPSLILEISDYLRVPGDTAVVANNTILDKARELGALRHRQQASLHQVLREYHLLHDVLMQFVTEEVGGLPTGPTAAETIALVSRLTMAVNVLSQSTTESFVTHYTQTIADQKQRLEQFTRMAAHEWRQPLDALQLGNTLIRQADLEPQRAERIWALIERNVARLIDLTGKLEAIARVRGDSDSPVVQAIELSAAIREVARQLREMAEARDVEIRVAEDLPTLTVDVGRLELLFVNLMSNAIKYADPRKRARYVSVAGHATADSVQIAVTDNGLGIPAHAIQTIFDRFTRAHADRPDVPPVSGIGLGLSIVADCLDAMRGRIDVRSVEGEGSTFTVTLPPHPAAGA